ncbi:MAG: hypothetical protein ACXVZJ_12095 [Terriglobales bacterium]
MIAAPTRHHTTEPAPRRDPIGFLLFYKMDWCERHPGLMFLAIGGLILLEGVFEQVFQ